MDKEQIDWKERYKEAALELERFENDTTEESLRSVLTHLTLGLQGQSEDLDTALDTLRSNLHNKEKGSLSKSLVSGIEMSVREMDRSRDLAQQELKATILAWVSKLKSAIDVGSDLGGELVELERGIPELAEKLYKLPALIQQILDLQANVLKVCTSSDEPKDSSGVVDKALAEPDLSSVGSELIDLISALNFDGVQSEKAAALVHKIESDLSLSSISGLLKAVVELVRSASQSTNEDFENYLFNLNNQLSEVQSFLQESHNEQNVAGEAHKQLDKLVRDDVSNIRQAVKNTHDLGELKMSVASQLSGIVRAMDEFKQGEEERESRLQERYDALMARVTEMEEETHRVKAHMEDEKIKARTDALTGLPNRVAYNDHMANEFNRWSRYQQGFSVAVGDLDFFKRINDTYGHLAGDKVLRLIARVLSKNSRSTDFVSRFGGEEFVILLPSTDVEEAAKAVEKLRTVISRSPFNFHGKPVTITMSFGVTQVKEGDSVNRLFERADSALYEAKKNGRNKVCIG